MTVKEADITCPTKKVPLCCSYRLVIALISCLSFANLYTTRVHLSVAIVCMINHTHLEMEETRNISENNTETISSNTERNTCGNTLGNTTESTHGSYTWSKELQGIILASFFWGYLLTQVVGGVLAERWGGKHVVGWSMLVNGVASVLIPVGSTVSPYLVIATRVLQGLCQGMVIPATQGLMAKWAPPLERTKLTGLAFAGVPLGSVISLPVSGLLCDLGFAGGWPSIFYLFGIFCFLWFILSMVLVASSPSQHQYISNTERRYIETSIGTQVSKQSTPWLKMMASPAVWAIIVAHACTEWGTTAMHTYVPTYMREVLKFDIKQNGALSAVPYLALWIIINIAAQISDALRVRGWKTVTVRKLTHSIGFLLPAAFLVSTGYIPCEMPYMAFVTLTLGISFTGFQYSGHLVNHMDIAPSFAGSLMGVANSFATASSITAPYLVAILTPNGTLAEWRVVFSVAAAIYTFAVLFYVLTAAGEAQSWAMPETSHNDTSLTRTKSTDHNIEVHKRIICLNTHL